MSAFGLRNILGGGKSKPKADVKQPDVKTAGDITPSAGPGAPLLDIEVCIREILEAVNDSAARPDAPDGKRSVASTRKALCRSLLDVSALIHFYNKSEVRKFQKNLEGALMSVLSLPSPPLFSSLLLRCLAEGTCALFGCGEERDLPAFVAGLAARIAVAPSKESSPQAKGAACYVLSEIAQKFDVTLWYSNELIPTLMKQTTEGVDPALRAAATQCLSIVVSAAGLHGNKHHAAVLKHLQSVTFNDAQHLVRVSGCACITGLAAASSGFVSVPFDQLVTLSCKILCDSHPSVRIAAALSLASCLATSVAAHECATANTSTADNNLEERDEMGSGRPGEEPSAGGDDTGENDSPIARSASTGPGLKSVFAKHAKSKSVLSNMGFRRKEDAPAHVPAEPQYLDVKACIKFIAEFICNAGRFAHRAGIRVGDFRMAAAVCGASFLRTLRAGTGALRDEDVSDVIATLLQCMRVDTDSTTSLYIAAISSAAPPIGGHARQAQQAVKHIIVFGLLTPPSQPGAFVPDKWRRWQQLVVSQLISEVVAATPAVGEAAEAPPFGLSHNITEAASRGTSRIQRAEKSVSSRISFRRSRSKISTSSASIGFVKDTFGAPNSQHLIAVLGSEILIEYLPAVLIRSSPESRDALNELWSFVFRAMAQQSHQLRRAAAELLGIMCALVPDVLQEAIAACLGGLKDVVSTIKNPEFIAGVTAAAVSSAAVDFAQFAQHASKASAGTGTSNFMKKLLGTGKGGSPTAQTASAAVHGVNVMTHLGASPRSVSHGGCGIPGAGPGSGVGICVGEQAAVLVKLDGYALALSACLAACRAADVNSLPEGLRSLLLEAADVGLTLLSHAQGLDGGTPGLSEDPYRSMRSGPKDNSQRVVAQLATAGAVAECSAASSRAACMVLSSLASCSDLLTMEAVWAPLYKHLCKELLGFRSWLDRHGIGADRDGTGLFIFVASDIPVAVSRASELLTHSSTISGGSMTPSESESLVQRSEEVDEDSTGVSTVRGLYTGVEPAWKWCRANYACQLAATVAEAFSPYLQAAPTASMQMYRLGRLCASFASYIPLIPSALVPFMRSASKASSQIFDDAADALMIYGDESEEVFKGTAVDEAYYVSAYGVSLTAIAVARQCLQQITRSAFQLCMQLPLNIIPCLPLRGPLLASALAVVSGGSVSLDLMSLGLVATEASTDICDDCDADVVKYLSQHSGLGLDVNWRPMFILVSSSSALPAVASSFVLDEQELCAFPAASSWSNVSTNCKELLLKSNSGLPAGMFELAGARDSMSLPALSANARDLASTNVVEAAIKVLAKLAPYLPLGLADAYANALCAPLRPSAAQAAISENPMLGYRFSTCLARRASSVIVARNTSAAVLKILEGLEPEHVRSQSGDDGKNAPPVPWMLTLRSGLGAAICNDDGLVRFVAAKGLGQLARLCGTSFAQKIVTTLQKQLSPASSANTTTPPPTLSPALIGGALLTIAAIKAQSWGIKTIEAGELLEPGVETDDTLLFEHAKDGKYSVRWPALYSWVQMVRVAVHRLHQDGATVLDQFVRYIQPSMAILESHLSGGLLPYDARALNAANLSVDSASTHVQIVGQTFSRDSTRLVWNDKGPGITVQSNGADVLKPAATSSDAWLGDAVLSACGINLPSSGSVAAVSSSAQAPQIVPYDIAASQDVGKDLDAKGAGVSLPLFDPTTADLLPPSGALTALIESHSQHAPESSPHATLPSVSALLQSLALNASSAGSVAPNDSAATDKAVLTNYRATVRAAASLGPAVTAKCIMRNVVHVLECGQEAPFDCKAGYEEPAIAVDAQVAQLLCKLLDAILDGLLSSKQLISTPEMQNLTTKCGAIWAQLCSLSDPLCVALSVGMSSKLHELVLGMSLDTATASASGATAMFASIANAMTLGTGPMSAGPGRYIPEASIASLQDAWTHPSPWDLILKSAGDSIPDLADGLQRRVPGYWHVAADRMGIVWTASLDDKHSRIRPYVGTASAPFPSTWLVGCLASGLVPCMVVSAAGAANHQPAGFGIHASGSSVDVACDIRAAKYGEDAGFMPARLIRGISAITSHASRPLNMYHAHINTSSLCSNVRIRHIALATRLLSRSAHHVQQICASPFGTDTPKSEIWSLGPVGTLLQVYGDVLHTAMLAEISEGSSLATAWLLVQKDLDSQLRKQVGAIPADSLILSAVDAVCGRTSPSDFWKTEHMRLNKLYAEERRQAAIAAAKMQGDFGSGAAGGDEERDTELGMFALRALNVLVESDDNIHYRDPLSTLYTRCSTILELFLSIDNGLWRRRDLLWSVWTDTDIIPWEFPVMPRLKPAEAAEALLATAARIVEKMAATDVEGGDASMLASAASGPRSQDTSFSWMMETMEARFFQQLVACLSDVPDPELPDQPLLHQHQAVLLGTLRCMLAPVAPASVLPMAVRVCETLIQAGIVVEAASLRTLLKTLLVKAARYSTPEPSCWGLFTCIAYIISIGLHSLATEIELKAPGNPLALFAWPCEIPQTKPMRPSEAMSLIAELTSSWDLASSRVTVTCLPGLEDDCVAFLRLISLRVWLTRTGVPDYPDWLQKCLLGDMQLGRGKDFQVDMAASALTTGAAQDGWLYLRLLLAGDDDATMCAVSALVATRSAEAPRSSNHVIACCMTAILDERLTMPTRTSCLALLCAACGGELSAIYFILRSHVKADDSVDATLLKSAVQLLPSVRHSNIPQEVIETLSSVKGGDASMTGFSAAAAHALAVLRIVPALIYAASLDGFDFVRPYVSALALTMVPLLRTTLDDIERSFSASTVDRKGKMEELQRIRDISNAFKGILERHPCVDWDDVRHGYLAYVTGTPHPGHSADLFGEIMPAFPTRLRVKLANWLCNADCNGEHGVTSAAIADLFAVPAVDTGMEWRRESYLAFLENIVRKGSCIPESSRTSLVPIVCRLLLDHAWLEQDGDDLYLTEQTRAALNRIAMMVVEALREWCTFISSDDAGTAMKPMMHSLVGFFTPKKTHNFDSRWLDEKVCKVAGQTALALAQSQAATFRSMLAEADANDRALIEGGMRAALGGQHEHAKIIASKRVIHQPPVSGSSPGLLSPPGKQPAVASAPLQLKKPSLLFDASKFKTSIPAPAVPAPAPAVPSILAAYLAGEGEEEELGMRAKADDTDSDVDSVADEHD